MPETLLFLVNLPNYNYISKYSHEQEKLFSYYCQLLLFLIFCRGQLKNMHKLWAIFNLFLGMGLIFSTRSKP